MYLYIFTIYCKSLIDDYIDTEISIYFALYGHLQLAELKNPFISDTFTVYNEYDKENEFSYNLKCKLMKNKNKYRITIGESHLCNYNLEATKCSETVEYFKIKQQKHGFRIEKRDKCLTYDKKLIFDTCGRKDQVFYFVKPNIEEVCKEQSKFFGVPLTTDEERKKNILDRLENESDDLVDEKDKDETDEKIKKEFEDEIKKYVKDLDDKPVAKKILEALHKAEKKWSWPSLSWLKDLFCP